MQDNQVPLFRFAVVEIDSSIIGGRDFGIQAITYDY